jgi:hypothetical protein
MRGFHHICLNHFNSGVIANDVGQSPGFHLIEHVLNVVWRWPIVTEEEAIPSLQVVELLSYQTAECGAKQGIRIQWCLCNSGGVDINILHMAIQGLKPPPNMQWNLGGLCREGGDGLEATDPSECVIARQAVVSASLDIPGHKVASKPCVSFRRMLREKMICEFIGKAPVNFLSILFQKAFNHWFNIKNIVAIKFVTIEQVA